jgi:anti-sigma B factor antagonist
MQIAVRSGQDVLTAEVEETRLDAAVAIQFKDRMREIVATGPRRVVLDLGRVGFLDSSGLGAVIAVKKMLDPDRELEIVGLTPPVERVFRLTRMDRVFRIQTLADGPEAIGR